MIVRLYTGKYKIRSKAARVFLNLLPNPPLSELLAGVRGLGWEGWGCCLQHV
jgi:hypothetical protein